MKIATNLDAKDAKALKARLEAELASTCGGEWCVANLRFDPFHVSELDNRYKIEYGERIPRTDRWRNLAYAGNV